MGERCSARLRRVSKLVKANKPAVSVRIRAALGLAAMLAAAPAPQMVRRDHPRLPNFIPGGAPNNPMGARAILLDRDEIAIHETTRAMRASIGTGASYGCIRMLNEDVIDLYDRVAVGASVTMTK